MLHPARHASAAAGGKARAGWMPGGEKETQGNEAQDQAPSKTEKATQGNEAQEHAPRCSRAWLK